MLVIIEKIVKYTYCSRYLKCKVHAEVVIVN